MKRFAFWLIVALTIVAPIAARADECTSAGAQQLARAGYASLDAHRWNDARTQAGELALYSKNCADPKVGAPSAVHSAYIGSAALHALGEDARAEQAVKMGLMLLDMLHKDGGYETLYSAMELKFESLARELKPPAGAETSPTTR